MRRRNGTLVLIVALCLILAFPAFVDAASLVIYNTATKTVTVFPSGLDDTVNIQAAFDWAVSQGPEATVQLSEGNFYTNSIVVKEFDGTFKGAGEYSTVIDTLRGINPEADPIPVYVGTDDRGNELSLNPTLFAFEGGGDITIKDIGFDISHPEPGELDDYAHGYWETHISTIVLTKRSPELYSSDKEIIVEHVSINGRFAPSGWPNILDGIGIGGMTHPDALHPTDRRWNGNPFTATVRVSDCTINLVSEPILVGGMTNGMATIERNTLTNSQIPVVAALLDNADIEIKDNYAETIYVGIWAMQERGGPTWTGEGPAPPSAPARVSIIGNTIHCYWDSDGIGLTDYMGLGLRALVSNNKIFMHNIIWGGIWGSQLQDAIITNNQIKGIGMAGIYVFSGYGCDLLGNNVQNVEATPNSWWLYYWSDWSPAPITLFGCAYFTVVGGSTQTNVLDLGGYVNTIVGVNNMGNPPGQNIADALEQKHEMMEVFRGF